MLIVALVAIVSATTAKADLALSSESLSLHPISQDGTSHSKENSGSLRGSSEKTEKEHSEEESPAPTPEPTRSPTPAPSRSPTPEPTPAPTPEPTPEPKPTTTPAPTPAPTLPPTPPPTPPPTLAPTPPPTTTRAAGLNVDAFANELEHPKPLPHANFTIGQEKSNLMKSPVITFGMDAQTWLHDPTSPQALIGIIVLLIGLLFCGCGAIIWQYIFAFLVAGMGACFVLYHGETLRETVPGDIGNFWLAGQTGITLFVAAIMGFEGTQVVLGALLGLAYAFMTDFVVQSWNEKFPFASFAWCCVGAALGVVFFTIGRKAILATLTPFFGGLLISTGAWTVFAHMGVIGFLSPELVWVDAVVNLFGNGGIGNFAIQVVLALIGAVAFKVKEQPLHGAAPIILGLVFSTLASWTGFACGHLYKCPSWLVPVQDWQWVVVGNVVWILCAAVGVSLQLSLTAAVDREKKSAKREFSPSKKESKSKRDKFDNSLETQGLLTEPQLGQYVSPSGSSRYGMDAGQHGIDGYPYEHYG